MREILFRGQHRRYGEQVNMAEEKLPSVWVYGGVLQGEGDFSIIYGSKSPDGKFEEKYSVYTETLGQYTGLTDKNGIKIFEGDILRVVTNYYSNRNEHKITVNFEEIENDSFGEPYTIGYCIMGGEWEIIGNIHDNPELLKEAT